MDIWYTIRLIKDSNTVYVSDPALPVGSLKQSGRNEVIIIQYTRVIEKTLQNGIEIPNNIDYAIELDQKNENSLFFMPQKKRCSMSLVHLR